MGFKFESNLPHQNYAVAGVLRAFEGITVTEASRGSQNPEMSLVGVEDLLLANLEYLRRERDFQQAYNIDPSEMVFDISMETGTGKTYVYTKTMLELNKLAGIAKFVIAVPRVAIKAGTVSFMKSDAVREHFRDEFGCEIKVYEVQSQRGGKTKKERMPQAISDFCRADVLMNKNAIHVLVINAGMITSKTMSKMFDVALWDEFDQSFAGVAHTKPVLIIDEPHMFKRGNKTYKEMTRFKPQFTLRYGATFDGDLVNMVNELTAVEAFNQDLVKGIIAHIEKFDEAKKSLLKLIELSGNEAKFELNNAGKKSRFALKKGESFARIHNEMQGLEIAAMNKSKILLSNGLELSKGATINPYSYAESLQDKMIQNAIRVHFENERELFLANPRIKPLTLFFIDNIPSYRDNDGAMKLSFNAMLKAHIEMLVSSETDEAYKLHLQNALKDISALHGGYFSKDNSENDDAIEAETLEILHGKEKLLSFDNPRRFVFSKWTLREGWDNPNVFTICKLRSSGSDTSKLQEVGRGLRLPVNEFMSRDKSKTYFLNYFVDFTESDFVERLVKEINSKSQVEFDTIKLNELLKARLMNYYDEFNNDEDALLDKLDELGIIKRNNDFRDGGYEKLKGKYPNAFGGGVKIGKIKSDKTLSKTAIRAGKYGELKELWEELNKKVVLEYKFENNTNLAAFFLSYIKTLNETLTQTGSKTETVKIRANGNKVGFQTSALEARFTVIKMMSYKSFLESLSNAVGLGVNTLHNAFVAVRDKVDINLNLSQATIRTIQKGFNDYLMQNVFAEFQVGYRKTSNNVHPTKFTNKQGDPLSEINSGEVGVYYNNNTTNSTYMFDKTFYDGQLELENILADIKEVIVYSKIPKNSIRIPLVGGGSYSPDFAYILKSNNGQSQLSLVVETKGKDELNMAELEIKKIKHAENYFNQSKFSHKIKFETQIQDRDISEIIKTALTS